MSAPVVAGHTVAGHTVRPPLVAAAVGLLGAAVALAVATGHPGGRSPPG